MTETYRVDKFVVPADVRAEFWTHVRRTHAVLREQPGFVDDALLEQRSGPGRFNVVTMVRWVSEAALEAAKPAVRRAHEAAGFDPAGFLQRAGITADLANYTDVRG